MKKNKIIIMLGILIFLGILYLYKENKIIEGNTGEGEKKKEITAAEAQVLNKDINRQMKEAGVPSASDPETMNIMSSLFDQLSTIVNQEVATINRKQTTIQESEDATTVLNTVETTCANQNFFTGNKFGDAFCKLYTNKNILNQKCSRLTSDNCNQTNCCVWINGNTCVAGSVNGPDMINGATTDANYYSYKFNCYGHC
jgi:hypothetical protein